MTRYVQKARPVGVQPRYKQLTLTIGMLCVMDHACGLTRVATVNYHVWVARSK